MYTLLFLSSLIAYLISAVLFIEYAMSKKNLFSKIALSAAIFGFLTQCLALIMRWLICGFAPMSNLYESMALFAWCVVMIFLIIEYRFHLSIIGAFIMPLAFLITGYSTLLDDTVVPLMPALQSYWLSIHVLICFLSYACFACAFCLGVMYLLQERQLKLKLTGKLLDRLPSLEVMDTISYNLVLFGFILLSAGIITGSIWASQAWGSWWSWDPKETWSFITWLIYAAYLHARLNSGYRGKRAAILSIIGFICVLFTYLGVSYLLPGLHSYL
ncbi:MAG: c-type cytochrome biogenesis protein CcsB [Candidatus Omnitrophica bacterium]|nr:c-type cytochrome biogenesis protein CcsB [Candidatus Omnitrophota bacterium]